MNPRTVSAGRKKSKYWQSCFWALVLVLGFAINAFADLTTKGVYYAGTAHQFMNYGGVMLFYFEKTYDGQSLTVKHCDNWNDPTRNISGHLGVCGFNGKLHCFFTNRTNTLYYVTKVPGGGAKTGLTKIAGLSNSGGAAAAVLGNSIYVFTASDTFTTTDGKNFKVLSGQEQPNAATMLDAITFYPLGDNPASVMVLYHNAGGEFMASVFDGTSFSNPTNLPNPSNWWIAQGNLVLGTSGGDYHSPGAKDPCIQFYGTNSDGQHGRWEYNLADRAWTFSDWTLSGKPNFMLTVYPWFETVDTQKGTMHMLHLLEMYDNILKVNPSDYLVPQNDDPSYGWAGTPTPTNTATEAQTLRSLWSLVGIVLGPPPFAFNGADDASYPIELSLVEYGHSQSQSVTTTQTTSHSMSVASENKIKGGWGKAETDLSYIHAWTHKHGTTHTVEVSASYGFGPIDEEPPDQGLHGWAIFNAPTLLTQWYKLYAYNYDQSSGQGAYLNQDMYATSLGAVVQVSAYFSLQDPSEGSFKDLFAGFPLYPNTTALDRWFHIKDWNVGGSDWSVIFGDKSSPQIPTLNLGTRTTVEYTQTDKILNSQSNTNSYEIKTGASVNLFGFSTGLTVAYDTSFETTTDVESTITDSVSCSMNMPIPKAGSPDDYVKSLMIQPYWLMAKTTKAPWIPPNYSGNLPWCITWNVDSYQTVGGKTGGTAPGPDWAWGILHNGRYDKACMYMLVGGDLTWRDKEGAETPLFITADEFDSSSGAAVSLSGYPFSADGTYGDWVRYGDVWEYHTNEGVTSDPFELELDFARGKWSFYGSTQATGGDTVVADGRLRVELSLEGKYIFTNWIEHHVNTTWSHKEEEADWKPFGVHWIEGDYNSRTGEGQLTLAGHILEETDLGDIQIVINGVSVAFPLLTTEGFLDKLTRKETVVYEAEDMFLEMDFGAGRWTSFIENGMFQKAMVPQGGATRVQVLVGGKPVSDQNFQINTHTTALSYQGS